MENETFPSCGGGPGRRPQRQRSWRASQRSRGRWRSGRLPCRSAQPCSQSRHRRDRVFRRGTRRERRRLRALIASHDVDGLLFAVAPRNRYGLRGAALHIGSFRRRDSRRKSMRPIPGNIIGVGVTDIARYRWCRTYHGFAIRRPVEEAACRRPQGRYIVSAVMPDRRTGKRMRRSNPSTRRGSRPGERLVRRKHQHDDAERSDKCPIHPIRHGTHQFVGY